ncbi:CCA tRNA nucleotidyltransferase, partial [Enterococcus faecalis]|nr:CCA tRNA nucleotidyltransferase [Enterococcus faecalis]
KRPLTKQDCYLYGKDFLKTAEELRAGQGLEVDFEGIDQLNASLSIHSKKDMVVSGQTLMKELGLKPGPHLGEWLKRIELAIVDGQLANDKEAILQFIKHGGADE